MISNYLNYLYNYYIVLSDTEISLNASISTEKVIHKNLLKKISKSKINNIKMEKRERKKIMLKDKILVKLEIIN